MKWTLPTAAGLTLLALGAGNQAAAQSNGLNSRDRALLYYRMLYQGPREQREQQQVQRQFQADLDRFQQSQYRSATNEDPLEKLMREGRAGKAAGEQEKGKKPLPPIYSGSGANRQYFMRINYFGSASQAPVQRPSLQSGRRSPRRYF